DVEPEPAAPGSRPRGPERRRRGGSALRPVASKALAAAVPNAQPPVGTPLPTPAGPPPAAAPSLIQQATQLFRAANCHDAIPLLERARAETPHSAEVFRLLGRCYSRAGRSG